jgi:DNA-binding NtrC family response regulator
MATWISYAIADASTSLTTVETALAGLASDPVPAIPAPSDIGLVVFDRITDGVLRLVRETSRNGSVRILGVGTSPGAVDDRGSWPLLDAGASDVVLHTDDDQLGSRVSARLARWMEIEELVGSPSVQGVLAGRSATWTSVLREIVEVASFSDAPVLLIGESGTGKDVVARLIHELDRRPFSGRFVKVDCRAIGAAWGDPELLRVDGATTGDETSVPSLRQLGVEPSEVGTVYLDEVEALPSTLQAALQATLLPADDTDREVDWPGPNVRLIASTTEDTSGAEVPGVRDDLSHRITSRQRLPPLRERRDDIPSIAEHLLHRFLPESADAHLEPEVADFLTGREYPSNAHDLLALVWAISARHVGPDAVTVGAIPLDERRRVSSDDLRWQGDDLERVIRRAIDAGASLKEIGETARDVAVRIALAREGGDVRSAARRLGAAIRTVASRDPGHHPVRPMRVEKSPGDVSPLVEVPDSAIVGAAIAPPEEHRA